MKKVSITYWSSFALGFGSATWLVILISTWQSQSLIVRWILGILSFACFIVTITNFFEYKKTPEMVGWQMDSWGTAFKGIRTYKK